MRARSSNQRRCNSGQSARSASSCKACAKGLISVWPKVLSTPLRLCAKRLNAARSCCATNKAAASWKSCTNCSMQASRKAKYRSLSLSNRLCKATCSHRGKRSTSLPSGKAGNEHGLGGTCSTRIPLARGLLTRFASGLGLGLAGSGFAGFGFDGRWFARG